MRVRGGHLWQCLRTVRRGFMRGDGDGISRAGRLETGDGQGRNGRPRARGGVWVRGGGRGSQAGPPSTGPAPFWPFRPASSGAAPPEPLRLSMPTHPSTLYGTPSTLCSTPSTLCSTPGPPALPAVGGTTCVGAEGRRGRLSRGRDSRGPCCAGPPNGGHARPVPAQKGRPPLVGGVWGGPHALRPEL